MAHSCLRFDASSAALGKCFALAQLVVAPQSTKMYVCPPSPCIVEQTASATSASATANSIGCSSCEMAPWVAWPLRPTLADDVDEALTEDAPVSRSAASCCCKAAIVLVSSPLSGAVPSTALTFVELDVDVRLPLPSPFGKLRALK